MQGVRAPLLEQLGYLHALLQLAVAGLVQAVDGRELDYLHEVFAAVTLHGLYALAEEAHAVLKAAAVLIRAMVEGLGHELVGEVAAVGVHLDRVRAGVHGQLGE